MGILIAGPARCGKSTLAAALVGDRNAPAALTVDALFPAFRSSKVLRSREARARFVRDYLRRPRFMDRHGEWFGVPLTTSVIVLTRLWREALKKGL